MVKKRSVYERLKVSIRYVVITPRLKLSALSLLFRTEASSTGNIDQIQGDRIVRNPEINAINNKNIYTY
jgi:hypothetical protein